MNNQAAAQSMNQNVQAAPAAINPNLPNKIQEASEVATGLHDTLTMAEDRLRAVLSPLKEDGTGVACPPLSPNASLHELLHETVLRLYAAEQRLVSMLNRLHL